MKLTTNKKMFISNRYVQSFAQDGQSSDELYDVSQFNSITTEIESGTSNQVDISEYNIYIDSIGISETFKTDNFYADTTAPTVMITGQKLEQDTTSNIENNVTNANTIRYTFTWSEALAEEKGKTFEQSDITVNNGTIQNFTGPSENDNGTYSYTIDVIPSIEQGKVGEVQVIVEKGACEDLVAHENVRAESVIRIDKQAPTVQIKADKEYVQVGEIITYTFTWSEAVQNFDETDIIVNNAEKVTDAENVKFTKISDTQYTLEAKPTNGNDVEVIIADNQCTDIAGNQNIGNKYIIEVIPTVTITTNTKNPTKENEIEYTFTWSEPVKDFTVEDITVPEKAIKGALTPKAEAQNTYTLKVNYDSIIPNGNEGEVTLAIAENAVQDSNGNGNAYVANTIKIDRIAPILISLEAFSDSNIKVDTNVDSVKEYYKIGDTVTIVATFSENVENSDPIPTLALQFSESKNAKGTVSAGTISGNKITYTYTITNGDQGELQVKGFNGKVIDVAGNETRVTKRELNGDMIVADSVTPQLIAISAVAPDFEYDSLLTDPGDTKRYGVKSKTRTSNIINFYVEYSKDIYTLKDNSISQLDTSTVPKLKIKFGANGVIREASASSVNGNLISYTYAIQSGDNGELSIVSLEGIVCDIAGNTVTTNTSLPKLAEYETSIQEENIVDNITADTNMITVNITETAIDKDDNGNTLTGNGKYYKQGSIVTFTATTNEYAYKNTNQQLQKFTTTTAPTFHVRFSENGSGTANCTNVEYSNGKTIFTYQYIIKEKDSGTITSEIATNVMYDIALNGNNAISRSTDQIEADTQKPVTNWQSWIESEQYGIVDNQNGTWTVTFSEKLYEYIYRSGTYQIGNELSNSNKASAPILLISNDNETALETTISNITTNSEGKTVITYSYTPYSRNMRSYGMKFANVCDRAGNLYNYNDLQAPTLYNNRLEVVNPQTGTYKAGEEITIQAVFNENIKGTAPTLAIGFSESGNAKGTVSSGTIENNIITYQYTITQGDNGKLSLATYTGGNIKDMNDNPFILPETLTIGGNTITADTIAPTVDITSNVTTANIGKIIYTFTWSEDVNDFTIDDIEVLNATKEKFTKVNNKKYTLEVEAITEGRIIVNVGAKVCTDIVGNPNEQRTTYNQVVIDETKPTIRAKINGGNYVIDTDTEKSMLKEIILIDEKVSKVQYVWSDSTDTPTEGWKEVSDTDIEMNNGITITTNVDKVGTYYLHVKVTDLAGNTFTGKTKGFVVNNSKITLTPDIQEATNQDVTVTVTYGEGLTENRKAGVQGKTQSADANTVIVSENGTVYAEATDIAGNKVYTTLAINNIHKEDLGETNPPTQDDTTPPEITFNYTSTTAPVKTVIGATITTNEDAAISYSWDKQSWVASSDYVRSMIARKTPTSTGTYTLYAKATDKAGNSTTIQELTFTVVESGETNINPEIEFKDLPTIQKNGVKYVRVSPNYTTEQLTAKMDTTALSGKTPVYKNLTKENGLKTGTEITIDGEVRYIVIVNGDVNCDGKVTFLGDIILINNYRIKVIHNLENIQILAGDINNTGEIDFIPDIVAMNNYRLGRIKNL